MSYCIYPEIPTAVMFCIAQQEGYLLSEKYGELHIDHPTRVMHPMVKAALIERTDRIIPWLPKVA